MKLIWVSFTMFHREEGTALGLGSVLASARYRILMPAAELTRRGHQVSIATVGDESSAERLIPQLEGDAVVFCKSSTSANERVAAAARARGMKIIFDLCDDHFDHPDLGAHYRATAELADQVTCSTPAMAEAVAHHCDTPCEIIDDPYEGVRQEPAFTPSEGRLELGWFGHPANWDSLEAAIPALKEAHDTHPLALTIVTRKPETPEQQRYFQRINEAVGGAFPAGAVPWSLVAQYQAMRQSDLIIIPSLENASKRVKSPNRMVESLWAGRMVVAQPVPSYRDFAQWAWVGADLKEGIDWAMRHREDIPARIAQAQDYIATRFAPGTIGERWEHVLRAAVAGRKSAQA